MAKPMTVKKCKVCGEEFIQYRSFDKWCSVSCGAKLGVKLLEKAKEAERKAFNRETKKRKERLKSRSEHLTAAQRVANRYARIRDKDDGCISCDKPSTWGGQWHGSHYRPAGNNSRLRFHWMNIHKACSECNNHKSGNLTEYRIKLIKKIGIENVEWLENQNEPYKWEVEDIKEVKKHFNEKIKELENENS